MMERGISVLQIKECISGFDRMLAREENKHYFQKSFGRDTLEAVAERKGGHYIVITAYYL